ncbi:MAG: hypothetical protein ACREI8_11810 [Myxococcota bacterium]
MQELPAYGLANTLTGFATLFSGALALAFCRLVGPQPARWRFAYWMVVVTGVFTVTLHGFGETVSGFGPRWLWAFLDTGSNIVVAWALALGVLGDYYSPAVQRRARALLTLAMLVGVTWHFYDRLPGSEPSYLVPLGAWGGFYAGECWLIAFSWLVAGLFIARREQIPPHAKPLLWLVVATFFVGMLLATASNAQIVAPFFAMHALWHLVGAFGFVAFWAFNHVRFEV